MTLYTLENTLTDPVSIGAKWLELKSKCPDYELIVSSSHLIFKYESPERVCYVHRPGPGKEIIKICVYRRCLRKGENI